jgi:hypothetical protein
VGEEIGEQTGYHHYQGFVQFYHRKSFSKVTQSFHEQAHIERAKGTFEQSYQYCTKEHRIPFEKNVVSDRRPVKSQNRSKKKKKVDKSSRTVKHESRKNSKKNGRWNGFTEGGH